MTLRKTKIFTVVHTPNLNSLSSLIKKLAMKKCLLEEDLQNFISKGTGLRLIHAKYEKDPMRNDRVIYV